MSALAYLLPEFGLRMPFLPSEFTQVNFAVNQQLLSRAVRMLEPRPDERVVDLFCGLGNFTLPLATRARRVLGIEGAPALVRARARNAVLNQADCSARPTTGGRRVQSAQPVRVRPAAW